MKMALERLEPCAMKVARTVLRRVVTGDSHDLSDTVGLQPPNSHHWTLDPLQSLVDTVCLMSGIRRR
jgi:hypothetical protein